MSVKFAKMDNKLKIVMEERFYSGKPCGSKHMLNDNSLYIGY